MSKPLLIIPTYNEHGNLEILLGEIFRAVSEVDILIIDDNSPDGTGELADMLSAADPRILVLHRSGKLGVGSAHLEGIFYAYEQGYTTVLGMDADFTHQPADLVRILDAAEGVGVVVASRFLVPNSLPGWNLYRRCLTHLGHFLTRAILSMPYDATGSLRLYRLDVIPKEVFGQISSGGYSFFFECLFLLHRNGLKIREVPVALPKRHYGSSKMRFRDVLKGVSDLVKLRFRARNLPALNRATSESVKSERTIANG